MPMPGVHLETIKNPSLYTRVQIERAILIAHALDRGKLVLTEPPRRP
jgi:hypothetical protein